MRYLFFINLLFLFCLTGFGQTAKYFISFKDKIVSKELLEDPKLFLSQKAIDRREKYAITITENDLPVNAVYVDSLQKLGANVWYTSKWMNGAYVQIDTIALKKIKALDFVIETEAMEKELQGGIQSISIDYGDSQTQNNMLGIPQMHKDTLTGKGVNIALIDGGYKNVGSINAFSKLNVLGTYDFVDKETNVYDDHEHGTQVLSATGAFYEGEVIGGAYQANYYLLRSENVATEYRIEEYNWLLAAEYADSVGVDIISTSLGYFDFDNANQDYTYSDLDGETALISRAANLATSKGILVIASAGNEGNSYWKRITFPAEATTVLAVGAVDSQEKATKFTSIGMIEGDKVKPNVSAHGNQTILVNGSGNVIKDNGTSFATPTVCGLLAGLMELYPMIKPLDWIEYAEKSASLYTNPDNKRGYGVPNYSLIRTLIDEGTINNLDNNDLLIYPTILISQSGELIIESNLISEKMTILISDVLGKEIFYTELDYQKRIEIPFYVSEANFFVVKVIIGDKVFTQKITAY